MGEIMINANTQKIVDRQLISLFYAHELCADGIYVSDQPNAMVALCHKVLNTLQLYDVDSIIEIIKECHISFPINKSDIPQFSSLDDCIYKVPYLIKGSLLSDITYEQMGYLLRTEPRTSVADCKYGENHAKTACQMGLCSINKCRINMSCLGEAFVSLTLEEQKSLAPKLILYIPLIQNYFAQGKDKKLLDSYLSIMSESTRVRRQSNVWTLIYSIAPKNLYDF